MPDTIAPDKALAFALGGMATIGFHSHKTGKTFWFYISDPNRKLIPGGTGSWNVYINKDFDSGSLYRIKQIRPKVFVLQEQRLQSIKAIEYARVFWYVWHFMEQGAMHPQIEILHAGTCSYCGRPLTDEKSRKLGIGPKCRKTLDLPY